jgi:hypothetical protein
LTTIPGVAETLRRIDQHNLRPLSWQRKRAAKMLLEFALRNRLPSSFPEFGL